MTGYREFRALTGSQIAALEQRIVESYPAWTAHWFVGPRAAPAVKARALDADACAQGPWRIHACLNGPVALRLPVDQASRILRTWLGDPESDSEMRGSALGLELVDRVLGDWFHRWAVEPPDSIAEPPAATPMDHLDPSWCAAFSGAAQLRIETWFGALDAVVSPDLAAHFSQPNTATRPHAHGSRTEAIRAAPIQVAITSPVLRSFSLRALQGLKPGDVVLLDADVATPWRLEVEGAECAKVVLGRKGPHRAVRVAEID